MTKTMTGVVVASVDSATQTSGFGSDNADGLYTYTLHDMDSSSLRAVVDTSPPFGSVEEAVIRFGGRGFWIPQPGFSVDASTATDDQAVSDVHKLDDKTATILKNLQKKEQETQKIMKELQLTKNLLEELKHKLPEESPLNPNKHPVNHSTNHPINKPEEHLNTFQSSAAKMIITELRQAKHNLHQNTSDLADLRASIEALSKKLDSKKVDPSMDKTRMSNAGGLIDPLVVSRELRELNYEAEQFMKTAEAAKSEVLKAMSDVEKTKTGLKVIEMRWVVAKKLEDAARAAESLALAEIRALSSSGPTEVRSGEDIRLSDQGKQGRISLSIDEYLDLADKAKKAETLAKKTGFEGFERIEEEIDEKLSKMVNFRNSLPAQRDSRVLDSMDIEFERNDGRPVRRGTTSIGDILGEKLVLRDDLEVGRQEESVGGGRQRLSLDQMLRRQRGETSPPKRREKEGHEWKNFFSKRKGLGFVHISLPLSKQSKNKIQNLNS